MTHHRELTSQGTFAENVPRYVRPKIRGHISAQAQRDHTDREQRLTVAAEYAQEAPNDGASEAWERIFAGACELIGDIDAQLHLSGFRGTAIYAEKVLLVAGPRPSVVRADRRYRDLLTELTRANTGLDRVALYPEDE